MFDKFEAFMNKYLTPIANKMDKQVHLSAIKKAMVAMTPLLIIGSFCLIPEAIPNMIGTENPISQWITANLDIILYSVQCRNESDVLVCDGYYRLPFGKFL